MPESPEGSVQRVYNYSYAIARDRRQKSFRMPVSEPWQLDPHEPLHRAYSHWFSCTWLSSLPLLGGQSTRKEQYTGSMVRCWENIVKGGKNEKMNNPRGVKERIL